MKSIFTVFLFVLAWNGFSQNVYTADKVYLGTRSQVVKEIVQMIQLDTIEVSGVRFSSKDYANCMVDVILPEITAEDLQIGSKEKDGILQMMMDRGLVKPLQDCMRDKVLLIDSVTYSSVATSEMKMKLLVEGCFGQAKVAISQGLLYPMTDDQTRAYCTCVMDEVIARNLSYGDMMRAPTELASPVREHVGIPCMEHVLGMDTIQYQNEYSNISSTASEYRLPVVGSKKSGYRVQFQVREKPVLLHLDTTVSESFLSGEDQRFLESAEALFESDVMLTRSYLNPNEEVVECSVAYFADLKIDALVLKEFTMVICPWRRSSLGTDFFNNFSAWHVDEKTKELVLIP